MTHIVDDDVQYANHIAKYIERLGQVQKIYSVEKFFSQFVLFFYDIIFRLKA